MFSMGGTAADRANAVRQGQMQESLGLRNQSLNEIMAMLQGGQVSMPQFSPIFCTGHRRGTDRLVHGPELRQRRQRHQPVQFRPVQPRLQPCRRWRKHVGKVT